MTTEGSVGGGVGEGVGWRPPRTPDEIQSLIDALGGLRPAARKLSVSFSTLQGWQRRGRIPENRLAQIEKAVLAYRVDLDAIGLAREAVPPVASVASVAPVISVASPSPAEPAAAAAAAEPPAVENSSETPENPENPGNPETPENVSISAPSEKEPSSQEAGLGRGKSLFRRPFLAGGSGRTRPSSAAGVGEGHAGEASPRQAASPPEPDASASPGKPEPSGRRPASQSEAPAAGEAASVRAQGNSRGASRAPRPSRFRIPGLRLLGVLLVLGGLGGGGLYFFSSELLTLIGLPSAPESVSESVSGPVSGPVSDAVPAVPAVPPVPLAVSPDGSAPAGSAPAPPAADTVPLSPPPSSTPPPEVVAESPLPPVSPVSPASLDRSAQAALAARLADLQTRLSGLEARLERLDDQQSAFRANQALSAAHLERLADALEDHTERLEALVRTTNRFRDYRYIAAQLRLLELREAVRSGTSFETPLRLLERWLPPGLEEDASLVALRGFAASGVPSDASLELLYLQNRLKAVAEAGELEAQTLWERLRARFFSLFRVSRDNPYGLGHPGGPESPESPAAGGLSVSALDTAALGHNWRLFDTHLTRLGWSSYSSLESLRSALALRLRADGALVRLARDLDNHYGRAAAGTLPGEAEGTAFP